MFERVVLVSADKMCSGLGGIHACYSEYYDEQGALRCWTGESTLLATISVRRDFRYSRRSTQYVNHPSPPSTPPLPPTTPTPPNFHATVQLALVAVSNDLEAPLGI